MPAEIKNLLTKSLQFCSTTPPSNHVMQFQSDQTQQANSDTAYITPELNSANLNFYNSDSYTPQHSDDEQLFKTPNVSPEDEKSIVSISIGATKIFAIKNKETHEEIHVALHNGDVLYMEGTTQKYSTHQVFCNPTNPSQIPELYDYPTMEEFCAFAGKRLNVTGRKTHTHTEGCPMAVHNPQPARRSDNYPTSPLVNYLPKQCPNPTPPTTAPVPPAADTAVDIPVPAASSDHTEA